MYVIFLFFTPIGILSAAIKSWLGTNPRGQRSLSGSSHNLACAISCTKSSSTSPIFQSLCRKQAPSISSHGKPSGSSACGWAQNPPKNDVPLKRIPGYVVGVCALICLFFIGVRHEWLGPHLTQQALGMKLDKWQIGPLRVINLVTFTIVFYWMRKYVLRLVAVEPFLTLGKASLHVFCAHVFFVFVGLASAFNNDIAQLHGWVAMTLLAVTFCGLVLVAVREVRKQREDRAKRDTRNSEAPPEAAFTDSTFRRTRASRSAIRGIAINTKQPP